MAGVNGVRPESDLDRDLPTRNDDIVKQPRTRKPKTLGYRFWEPSLLGLLKACVAECVGTSTFVFLATAAVTSGCHTSDVAASSGNGGDTSLTNVAPGSCFLSQTSTLLNIALAFGFSLFVSIYFTASFSGGHLNPAVTLAMFLTRKISLLRGIAYTAFQCGGAAMASIVLKGLDSGGFKAAAGAANQVNRETGTTVGDALGFEIVLTFVLVFTVFAATDSERVATTAPLPILAPLSIGMVVFVIHLVGIPIDGTSVNPARSFGPAMVARVFHNYWIFWVGPYAGAIAAAALYEIVFKSKWERGPTTVQDVEAGVPITTKAERPIHPRSFSEHHGITEPAARPNAAVTQPHAL